MDMRADMGEMFGAGGTKRPAMALTLIGTTAGDAMAGAMAEADGARRGRFGGMRHLAAIQALAAEVGRPVDEIAAVYQGELVLLAANAVVEDYLPVLVMKRVRRLYQHRLDALHEDDVA
jgi:hypothetical protein